MPRRRVRLLLMVVPLVSMVVPLLLMVVPLVEMVVRLLLMVVRLLLMVVRLVAMGTTTAERRTAARARQDRVGRLDAQIVATPNLYQDMLQIVFCPYMVCVQLKRN